MFFNRLKSDFVLVTNFSPVIDYELKFVKMQLLITSISPCRARLSEKNLGASWPLSFHFSLPVQVF